MTTQEDAPPFDLDPEVSLPPSGEAQETHQPPIERPDVQTQREFGLLTPTSTSARRQLLCPRCHKTKRNHTCTGRYIPARQLTIARRRLGLATPGQSPIFGIVDLKTGTPEVYGVFAPNDVRALKHIPARLVSWAQEAQKAGRTGPDIWNDFCAICENKGQLYMCYGCNLSYHPRCSVRHVLNRRLKDKEEFLCPDCLRDSLPQNRTATSPAPGSQ